MKHTLLLLLGLTTAAVHAGSVYRWVDDQGNVHYTDTPRPDAETIELPEPNVYSPPAKLPKLESGPEPRDQAADYKKLEITQPQPEATIWDNQGNFPVSLRLEPSLDTAAGHRIQLRLDGQVRTTTQSLQAQFTGVNRGAHTLQATVVDANGKALIQSEPVTLFLHQQSVNLPARKANP